MSSSFNFYLEVASFSLVLAKRNDVAFIILRPGVAPGARRGNAKRHIGVFGVSDDKGLAPERIGMDVGEFCVE